MVGFCFHPMPPTLGIAIQSDLQNVLVRSWLSSLLSHLWLPYNGLLSPKWFTLELEDWMALSNFHQGKLRWEKWKNGRVLCNSTALDIIRIWFKKGKLYFVNLDFFSLSALSPTTPTLLNLLKTCWLVHHVLSMPVYFQPEPLSFLFPFACNILPMIIHMVHSFISFRTWLRYFILERASLTNYLSFPHF